MPDRLVTSIIALGLASLVWLYTRSRDQEMLDNYPVPVSVRVAPEQAGLYDLEINGPGQVAVSFSGPPSRIRELRNMLQRGEVNIQRTVSVPESRLPEARYVDTLRLEPSDVPVLPGVQAIIAESQNHIGITLRRLIERRMPVRLQHTAGDRMDQIVIEPSSVLVRGHKEILETQQSLPTQLYTVSGAVEPRRPQDEPMPMEAPERVLLVQELEGRRIQVTPSVVSVRFTLKPRQKVHELADVPVHFLCPAQFPFRPQFTSERAGKIALRIVGPASETRPLVSAYVDLTARKFGEGLHAEEPIRVQLPPGFQLAQEPPRLASFQLLPMESPK